MHRPCFGLVTLLYRGLETMANHSFNKSQRSLKQRQRGQTLNFVSASKTFETCQRNKWPLIQISIDKCDKAKVQSSDAIQGAYREPIEMILKHLTFRCHGQCPQCQAFGTSCVMEHYLQTATLFLSWQFLNLSRSTDYSSRWT
jgi:hypothetical protein